MARKSIRHWDDDRTALLDLDAGVAERRVTQAVSERPADRDSAGAEMAVSHVNPF